MREMLRHVFLIGSIGFVLCIADNPSYLVLQAIAAEAFSTPACEGEMPSTLVTITTLLTDPDRYHLHYVTVRGRITQPELHMDETELFLDFVFVLENKDRRLMVFGRFDRTLGNNPIATDAMVEVTGLFWKERMSGLHRLRNNLEACHISPYPPLIPDAV